MLWIGLLGESLMGSLRVYIFGWSTVLSTGGRVLTESSLTFNLVVLEVQSTSSLPQTAFPLPFFLHFAILSARLLHFVLALWAVSSPRREFVPAIGRRLPGSGGSSPPDTEREGLLAGAEESNLGGGAGQAEASGYGTFVDSQESQEGP